MTSEEMYHQLRRLIRGSSCRNGGRLEREVSLLYDELGSQVTHRHTRGEVLGNDCRTRTDAGLHCLLLRHCHPQIRKFPKNFPRKI